MPERWIAWCRRRVPESLRQTAFDPSLADLRCDWAVRGAAVSFLRQVLDVARLVWQCRRLRSRSRRQPAGRARVLERIAMLFREVRFATRRLVHAPAFALTAVSTLALGIGANLAVFAFVQALLLAPVNAPEPDRLVRIFGAGGDSILSWLDYADARARATTVDLAAHGMASPLVGTGDATEQRSVELVSGNYFQVLGQRPQLGRPIEDPDNRAELASPVAVLSDDYWRSRYVARPDIVGTILHINGAPFEIVGIAPPGFRGTFHAHAVDLWTPIGMQQQVRPRGLTLENRNWGFLRVIGRLRPGTTLEAVQAELDAVAADRNRRFPPSSPANAFALEAGGASALAEHDQQILSPVVTTVFAFTVVLFLVTCLNIAGVLQARLFARARELGIRKALGASRGRAASEWAAECLLLTVAAGLAGLLLAQGVVHAINQVRPPEPLAGDLRVIAAFDWRLAPYGLGLTLLAGAIIGLVPTVRAARSGPLAALKDESGTATTGRAAGRWRRSVVVLQFACSGVLLFAASLLGTSLVNQQVFSPGFETSRLGLLAIDLERQRVPESEWRRLADLALERVRQDPGVRAADLGYTVPLGFGEDTRAFRIPGHTPPDGRTYVSLNFNVVGRRYFEALGVPFVRGGSWPAGTGGPWDVVINETMARRFWSEGDPVGQTIEMVGTGPVRIAGVARDTSYYEVAEDPLPFVYLPAERQMPGAFVIHVRTSGDPAPVVGRLRRALDAADTRLSAHEAMTFEALRRVPLFPARLLAVTASVFGGLAILLASVGLYGVVTMSVSQRSREIGVRMALGAPPQTVLRSVLRDALVLAMLGLALALPGSVVAAGALGAWLFDVSVFEPRIIGLVAGLMTGLAILAAWMPARRAAQVDPVLALRA